MSAVWDSSHEPALQWRGGQWSLELRDDEVADIAWEGRSVLRSVRAVIRDCNWDTAQLVVSQVHTRPAGLTLSVYSVGFGSSFEGTISVDAQENALYISCDLTSTESFSTNRTGLVVLHPPSLAGVPLRIAHLHGEAEQAIFPTAISPNQPAFDIEGLAWDSGGLHVDVRFTGDVFEMEDQRNWTDASFKTYNRPLALPFPYRIAAGERVHQTLAVTVRDTGPAATAIGGNTIDLFVADWMFPAIGTEAATAPDPAPAADPAGSMIVVELDFASQNWKAALSRAGTSALPLDVRIIVRSTADMPLRVEEAVAALAGLALVRVSIFDADSHVSEAEVVSVLRSSLASHGITVPVAGGSRSHFTELNRLHHRLPADLDALTTTITPLFHSSATEQLIESVSMQRLVAMQAVQLAGQHVRAHGAGPVSIGPISLRPRFNNVATAPALSPGGPDLSRGYGPELTGTVDARQGASELGAWLIASGAALAIRGVDALSYFEEWGPRGLRDSLGRPLPALRAFTALARLSGGKLATGPSPDGLLWAVGSVTPAGIQILAANLDRTERTVRITAAEEEWSLRMAPLTWQAVAGKTMSHSPSSS